MVSALEVTLLPECCGQGGSAVVLRAMAEHLLNLGHETLFVPVRPNAKHLGRWRTGPGGRG